MNSRVEAIQEMLIQAGDLNTLAERIDARLSELEQAEDKLDNRAEKLMEIIKKYTRQDIDHVTCDCHACLLNQEAKNIMEDKPIKVGKGTQIQETMRRLEQDKPVCQKCGGCGFTERFTGEYEICPKCDGTKMWKNAGDKHWSPCPVCQAQTDEIEELDMTTIDNTYEDKLQDKINELVRWVNKQGKEGV